MLKRRAHAALLGVALGGVAGACAARAPATSPEPAAATVDSIVESSPLYRTHWGIHVVDAASGDVVLSRNFAKHFIPASNMKLVIGAAVLALLGEEHRYRTELRASAAAGDSVARLVVVGSGDPTWSTRFYPSATAPLDSMARTVRQAGITAAGELVLDATRFRDGLVHPTWEVSDLGGGSAPPVEAVAIAEGTFRLELRGGGARDEPGEARTLDGVEQPLRAYVRTDTAGARTQLEVDYTARKDTVYVRASVAAGTSDTVTLAVTQPATVAAAALADVLRRAGIRVAAWRTVRDSAAGALARDSTHLIGVHRSPPMSAIVAAMLAPSQNWIAEQLLKTLGAEHASDGSWRGGIAAERAFLSDVVGIDSAAVQLRDASGLSAQNLLTPEAAVALLRYARGQPWGATFRAGLAQPGMPGTLSNRLQPLAGRLFAKTGTITNVNSLSGYLVTDDGREFIFSVFSNASGLPAATVRNAIDQIVLRLARASAR